ncbi:hypothetical protein [Streptomyces erythrochromogenes]|uniref:hypothetical protein n=1 Tax=Streptomyces erythrochromogenes TaxID=285574 RepID=UPI0022507C0B|nr:hypothetical protein [Streptomyces erythrochromogenes]MCX5587608.1 hypothetical protein [Streptomyces erythrochromogenes]
MNALPSVLGADLPALAYSHSAAHDPALTHPAKFRPVLSDGWVKPKSGSGLWTAPITARTALGAPSDTAWLTFCREELWGAGDAYTHLTEIQPEPAARVLRIDTQADLIAIAGAYPAQPIAGLSRGPYPDWAALAADWDAVYLTDDGQWATRLPYSGPDLYGWDVASVLWLRPRYSVGATVAVAA